jgi:hypothetical protein
VLAPRNPVASSTANAIGSFMPTPPFSFHRPDAMTKDKAIRRR